MVRPVQDLPEKELKTTAMVNTNQPGWSCVLVEKRGPLVRIRVLRLDEMNGSEASLKNWQVNDICSADCGLAVTFLFGYQIRQCE